MKNMCSAICSSIFCILYKGKSLVDGKMILTNSTHVKASVLFKRNNRMLAQHETTDYMERLDRYEAKEHARLEACGAPGNRRECTIWIIKAWMPLTALW